MSENRIPEQNPPIKSYESQDSHMIRWILGGICVTGIAMFGYLVHRIDSMENNMDAKYRSDHDKIIKLETQMEVYKKGL